MNREDRLALSAIDAAALVGVSRAQWWKLQSSGKIPLPVYLGAKAPRWRLDELRAWLAAGAPDRQTWLRIREDKR
jgi:predicted DNA-binding transcriptional regulator AlpA